MVAIVPGGSAAAAWGFGVAEGVGFAGILPVAIKFAVDSEVGPEVDKMVATGFAAGGSAAVGWVPKYDVLESPVLELYWPC